MGKGNHLGEFEQLVILAVRGLRSNAYGMTVRQVIHETTGRDAAIGSVYAALARLEQKGFVSSWTGDATAERGGRAKRYFEVTGAGARALAASETARRKMRIVIGQLDVGRS